MCCFHHGHRLPPARVRVVGCRSPPLQPERTTAASLPLADNFSILTFFNFFLKITHDKYYLHPMTSLAASGGVARQPAFAAPHWPAAAREKGVGPGLPRHPAWRGSAKSRGPARPPFFFFLLLPFFLSRPKLPRRRRRRRWQEHPQIRRFVVGIVWKIDPCILGRYCPYLILVLALNFFGFCMYR
jgi:hypothetical protein